MFIDYFGVIKYIIAEDIANTVKFQVNPNGIVTTVKANTL